MVSTTKSQPFSIRASDVTPSTKWAKKFFTRDHSEILRNSKKSKATTTRSATATSAVPPIEDSDEKPIPPPADERKSQVGSGDRSERIRTYNFPQSRITDHRINLTIYKLEQFLNGELDEVVDALITSDRAAKLSAGTE